MLFKLIGAGMIALSSAVYAERVLTGEKKRIEHLCAVIDLISYIRNQIDLYSMPLEKIYKNIDADKQRRLCINSPPSDFLSVIERGELDFDEDTKRELIDFSSKLGRGYREMQLKLCDQILLSLANKKKQLSDAFPSRKKTVIALCFGVGGVVLIALI